jgi:hypothetical protein
MNPIEQLIGNFQNLVSEVPEFLQPLIVMLAGAIPFVEGEIASMIGVIGGVNPIIAAIAGASGNFLCVLVVVLVSSRARSAVVSRRTARASAKKAQTVQAGQAGQLSQTTRLAHASGGSTSTADVPTTSIATVDVADHDADHATATATATADSATAEPEKPVSKGRQRFNKWVVRFGVPGASILGPLAIPTQITSAILVAGGTPKGWILLWQAVAIVFWTTVGTTSIWLALQVAVQA